MNGSTLQPTDYGVIILLLWGNYRVTKPNSGELRVKNFVIRDFLHSYGVTLVVLNIYQKQDIVNP